MIQPGRIALELARKHLGRQPIEIEERRVVEHIEARRPISQDAGNIADLKETGWNRLADSVARIGGSWPFIGAFFLFLFVWTGVNGYALSADAAFDPYPFIFLNLVLSMLAAIQAPIIMMSQNRQAEKDRIAATHDYEVNLRSELEILAMQQKLDSVRGQQHDTLLAQQNEILHELNELRDDLAKYAGKQS